MQKTRALSEGVVGRKLLKKCGFGAMVVVVVGVEESSCLVKKLLLFLWPSSGIRLKDTNVSFLSSGFESDILLKRMQSMSLSSDWPIREERSTPVLRLSAALIAEGIVSSHLFLKSSRRTLEKQSSRQDSSLGTRAMEN